MNAMKLPRLMVGAGLGALMVWGLAGELSTGAEIKSRADTQTFMRVKMAWSQAVLEGLTFEKFDVISRNAIRMRDMTQSNQWFVVKQPDYMQRTTNYQKSVDALYMAAIDKNLDAATEAYAKVVKNCVDCHRLVRTDQHKNLAPITKPKPLSQHGPP